MTLPKDAPQISFPSTGDADEDAKIAANFHMHSSRMAKNICPNGCGDMVWIDAYNRECKSCGFTGFSTKPYDMEGGQA